MGNNSTVIYEPADDLDKLDRGFVLFCVVFQSILCVIGGGGNLLTIIAVIFTKTLHKTYNAYIVHLAVVDLLICVMLIPSNIQGLLHEGVIPANCEVIGAISLMSLVVSILSLMMIAINRYILICKTFEAYNKFYNKKTIVFTTIGMWIWALAVVLPLLAFDGLGWSQKTHYCFFINYDFTTYLYITVGLAQMGVVIPAAITAFCYIMIIRKLRKSAKRLQPHTGSKTTQVTQLTEPDNMAQEDGESNDSSNRTQLAAAPVDVTKQQQERREAKRKAHNRRIFGLIIIFTIFMMCWLPIAITFTIDYRQQLPGLVYVLFITIAWVNSSVNVFLYAFTNQLYRHSYKCILTCKFSELNSHI